MYVEILDYQSGFGLKKVSFILITRFNVCTISGSTQSTQFTVTINSSIIISKDRQKHGVNKSCMHNHILGALDISSLKEQ